LRSLSRFRSAS